MSDENLTQTMLDHQRKSTLKHLSERPELSLGQIAKLIEHPKLGETAASITLGELLEAMQEDFLETHMAEPSPAKEATRRSAKKTAKKAAKKSSKKAASKKKVKKTPVKRGAKADKGKPKPRLDYDRGTKEVLAAMKAAGEPVGRKAIESATGYSAVQVRSFLKRLNDRGKVTVLGEGRKAQYAIS